MTKNVYGTAFSIGNGCFATAGHVIQNASHNQVVAIGFPDGTDWKTIRATDYEVIESYDVGFIQAEVPKVEALSWRLDELPMLATVQTVGYPYAIDWARFAIDIRAFRGHVVSALSFDLLKANPRVYELSFQSPRGLSGAPLFTTESSPQVVGLIVKNRATQMLVLSSREKVSETAEKITETYESLQLGIAVQSGALADVHSQLLNGTLREHLRKMGLLKMG